MPWGSVSTGNSASASRTLSRPSGLAASGTECTSALQNSSHRRGSWSSARQAGQRVGADACPGLGATATTFPDLLRRPCLPSAADLSRFPENPPGNRDTVPDSDKFSLPHGSESQPPPKACRERRPPFRPTWCAVVAAVD